jgi:hypothetical protein
MSAPEESLRDKLIIAVVQTLIIGALLAVLGYWLNVRLETYKQSLSDQSEKTKAILSSHQPFINQRRDAYLDFRQDAREAKNVLEIYYYRARGTQSQEVRLNRLEALENKMGI